MQLGCSISKTAPTNQFGWRYHVDQLFYCRSYWLPVEELQRLVRNRYGLGIRGKWEVDASLPGVCFPLIGL